MTPFREIMKRAVEATPDAVGANWLTVQVLFASVRVVVVDAVVVPVISGPVTDWIS